MFECKTEIDLNESEIDFNKCKHFLKVNLDRSEIDLSLKTLQMAERRLPVIPVCDIAT